MAKKYQVVVIGSGPGGYVCAIRAAQLGLKVAVIEKYASFGGTCLNVGCIPSKALLDSSEHVHLAKTSFQDHGISVGDVKVDMAKMIERKRKVVSEICKGVAGLFKKNKIDTYEGVGSFEDKNKVAISNKEKKEVIEAENVIIATGSKPSSLPNITVDKKYVITSTEALEIETLPKRLVVIGAGFIGLELGSVFARLGTDVTVVEYLDRILPIMDRDCSKQLARPLKSLGMRFLLNTKVEKVETKGKGKKTEVVAFTENRKGEKEEIAADLVLVSVGRRPYTDGLGLENIGISTDKYGKIAVDEKYQVCSGVYAIGDVVSGPMLAHKASEEGVAVAEIIAGQKPHLNYLLIPSVVYTAPEVASVGYTEEQLKEKDIKYRKGMFPFKASGRAKASHDTDGMIKVLSDEKTDEILGVHMVGPRCSDIIGEAVVAMEYRASAEDIGRIIHAHPTFTEVFKEAALAASGMGAIHI